MDWQIYLAISIVFSSVAVLLQRILLHKDNTDPIAYAVLFEGLVGLILLAAAVINGIKLPDFSLYAVPIIATFLAFAFGNIAYAKSLKAVDASIFSVLFATNAVWVMIGGVLLFNEKVSVAQFFGAALILLSVILLADRTGKFKLDRGMLLGLLCGVFYGVGILGWVYISKRSDLFTWNALTFLVPSLFIFLFMPKSASKMRPFLRQPVLGRILLLCLLVSTSSAFLLNAFNNYNASIISPLIQTEVFLTVLLAIVFLHERDNLRMKLIAAAFCMGGVVLIVS